MKYAKARQGMEECFLTRGIELGMQLVLDSMIALGDICLYFSISKTLISDSLLFFSVCYMLAIILPIVTYIALMRLSVTFTSG